ncbi:putative DNA polymerase IV [Aneurinibacillus aneurinilyticus ATCC 12856]|uniref:DNA polymerase IV n=1 Tax=Aneurinibacillus aneurinilyticus ATCC 12856 TaxID=649747 RepID=U1X613_ANEAE|nr:putative DNA polymerase IV [Aneurinibacillus aneurinilyticus ATCC 12856]
MREKAGKGADRVEKTILLCDMNSFFASVHQSYNPQLRNKPVIVAGNPEKRKGIVVAASYDAKAKGVYTTMRFYRARKLCPEAVFVQPNHALYRRYSEAIMRFLRRIAPCEVASVDEAYLDISELVAKGHTARIIAEYIQDKLYRELLIPSSIGAGPTKLIAKMCADVKKPGGFVEMGARQYRTYFWPQTVGSLHGCGKSTAERLQRKGIRTIGELAAQPVEDLRSWFGKKGEYLHQAANGTYESPVNPERQKGEKSIGSSRTFAFDTMDQALIAKTAREFSEKLADKLKQKQKKAKTIVVEVKFDYRQAVSRSLALTGATDEAEEIYRAAMQLYEVYFSSQPLRLFGIRLHHLLDEEYEQLRFSF